MVRITDIEKSLDFYCNKLGLKEVRRSENEKSRYTLIFLAAELEIENDETNTLCDKLPVPRIFPEITTAFPSSVSLSILFKLIVFLFEFDFKTFFAIFDQIGASYFLEADFSSFTNCTRLFSIS